MSSNLVMREYGDVEEWKRETEGVFIFECNTRTETWVADVCIWKRRSFVRILGSLRHMDVWNIGLGSRERTRASTKTEVDLILE
jgi:hypothetical protein